MGKRQMYFLSVDAGTSSVKAAVFDPAGKEVATSVKEYHLEKPRPGLVEVPPETYWEKASEAISEAAAGSGDPSRIRALGVTSQGETLVTLDREGKPNGKAIVWLDARAGKEAEEIESVFGIDRVYRVTGQSEISAGYTASMILWIKKNDPGRFRKTSRFLLVADYIVFKLTGNYFTNNALCPSTLYYDFNNRSWWPEMLEFLGIEESNLPELLDSGSPAGRVSAAELGLNPDTVVCPAPIDQVSGTLGAGNTEPGGITEATGTVLALCAVTDRPVFDREKRFGLFPHAIEGRFLAMPWAPASGSILSWFKSEFCPGLTYEQITDEAEKVSPGCGGLTVLPYFEGINCPEKLPDMRGAVWGLTLRHGRGHFVRAIMEAVAYLLKDYLCLLEANGIEAGRVISLGGASKNLLWSQIKADVTGRHVVTNRSRETVCLGASMVAAVGAGIFEDCRKASLAMASQNRIFKPSHEGCNIYKPLYADYLKLSSALKNFHAGQNHEKRHIL